MGFKPDNAPSGFRPDTVTAPASSTAVSPVKDESGGMGEAFMRGGLKGATLGLDRPIISGAEAAGTYFNQPDINKRSFMDLMMESLAKTKAEEEELKKKHPFAYGGGEALSYAIPGAGSARVFESVGGKAASKMASPLAQSFVKGAAGVGAAEGLKKAADLTQTGKDVSAVDFLTQMAGKAPEAVVGGAMGPAGTGLTKGVSAIASKVVPELTGVPYAVLQKYASDPRIRSLIKQTYGKEGEHAVDLAAHAENPPIPEYDQAVEMLRVAEKSGVKIDPTRIKQQLDEIIKAGPESPSQEPGISELTKWSEKYIPKKEEKGSIIHTASKDDVIKMIAEHKAGSSKTPDDLMKEYFTTSEGEAGIPPLAANKLKQLMREKLPYGERGADFIDQKLKGLSKTLQEDIETKIGPEYVDVMRGTASKMDALTKVTDILGKNTDHWESRSENLLRQAYKVPEKMKALQAYDEQFGTTFADDAYAMGMARELGGKTGGVASPSVLPVNVTGRAGIGPFLTGGGGLASILLGQGGHITPSQTALGLGLSSLTGVAQSPAAVVGTMRAANALAPATSRGLQGASAQVTDAMRRKMALEKKTK